MFTDLEYNEYCRLLKEKTKVVYDATQPVICPYFKSSVTFNAEGFHHIQYNTSGSERPKRVQIDRYRLFPLASALLERAGTVQQHRKSLGPVGRKRKDGFHLTKTMEDWCFVALVPFNGREVIIKVVVRRIGDGNLNFLSIMPHKAPNYLFDIN